MDHDNHLRKTQPSPAMQPPRPPGPPTQTAIGLAPELPDPADRSRRQTTARINSPPNPSAAPTIILTGQPLRAATAPTAKPLPVDALLAVIALAVSVSALVLVIILQ